jgi:hypothetical protein
MKRSGDKYTLFTYQHQEFDIQAFVLSRASAMAGSNNSIGLPDAIGRWLAYASHGVWLAQHQPEIIKRKHRKRRKC